MRTLSSTEPTNVSGAGCCYTPPSCTPVPPPCSPGKTKGNNGFGNGAYDGVPGHSGKTDLTR